MIQEIPCGKTGRGRTPQCGNCAVHCSHRFVAAGAVEVPALARRLEKCCEVIDRLGVEVQPKSKSQKPRAAETNTKLKEFRMRLAGKSTEEIASMLQADEQRRALQTLINQIGGSVGNDARSLFLSGHGDLTALKLEFGGTLTRDLEKIHA